MANSSTPRLPRTASLWRRDPPAMEGGLSLARHLGGRIARSGRVLLWVLVWYSFSSWSTFINKTLLRGAHISPITLTFLHLFFSVFFDGAILVLPMGISKLQPVRPADAFRTVAPVSFGMVFNKMFTYLSYGLVPVSLTHTVKASSPIFAVLLSYFWMGRTFPKSVYLSLVPIVVGVSLASISEMEYNHMGFLCALLSSLINVGQNMYAKRVMSGGPFDEWNLHFYVGSVAVALLLPFVVALELVASDGRPALPYGAIVLCSCLQYVASIASYIVLSLIADITFTVANVLKRLFIIVASVVYFGQSVSAPNAGGMAIALAGAALYDVAKRGVPMQARPLKKGSDVEAPPLLRATSSELLFPFARSDGISPPTEDSKPRRPASTALMLRRASLWVHARFSAAAATLLGRALPEQGLRAHGGWPGHNAPASAFHAVPHSSSSGSGYEGDAWRRRERRREQRQSHKALKMALGGGASPSDTFVGLSPSPSLSTRSTLTASPADPTPPHGPTPPGTGPLGGASDGSPGRVGGKLAPVSRTISADARVAVQATHSGGKDKQTPSAYAPDPVDVPAAPLRAVTAATSPQRGDGGGSVLPQRRHASLRRAAPPHVPLRAVSARRHRRLSSVAEEEDQEHEGGTPSPPVAGADAGAGGVAQP